MLSFSNSVCINTVMRIPGILMLYEVCSFPTILWGPQRVTLLFVNSFSLASIRTFAVFSPSPQASMNAGEGAFSMPWVPAFSMQGTSRFHFTNTCGRSHHDPACHICCFLGISSFSDVSLSASCSPLCAFTVFPSHFLRFLLYSPLFFVRDSKAACSRSPSKCKQNHFYRNASRTTFIFNHCFCPRLWHWFLEKNTNSVHTLSSSPLKQILLVCNWVFTFRAR